MASRSSLEGARHEDLRKCRREVVGRARSRAGTWSHSARASRSSPAPLLPGFQRSRGRLPQEPRNFPTMTDASERVRAFDADPNAVSHRVHRLSVDGEVDMYSALRPRTEFSPPRAPKRIARRRLGTTPQLALSRQNPATNPASQLPLESIGIDVPFHCVRRRLECQKVGACAVESDKFSEQFMRNQLVVRIVNHQGCHRSIAMVRFSL